MRNNRGDRNNFENNGRDKDCPDGVITLHAGQSRRGPRGFTGVPGPAGPMGPAGPQGSSSFDALAYIRHSASDIVVSGQKILFDSVDLAIGMSYSPATGLISSPKMGQYLINWWINVANESDSSKDLIVDFNRVSSEHVQISRSISTNIILPSLSDVLVGTAIFSVMEENSSFAFFNSSEINIRLIPRGEYSAAVTINRIN